MRKPKPHSGRDLTAMEAAQHLGSWRQSRAMGLVLLTTIILLIFLWTLTWDPLINYQLRLMVYGKHQDHSFEELLKNDPKPGITLSTDGAGLAIRKSSKSQKHLLVYAGGCLACQHTNLAAWERNAALHSMEITFFLPGSGADAERFRLQAKIRKARVIPDPEGRLARHMNAFMSPRAYLFTADWHLVGCQKVPAVANYDPFQLTEANTGFARRHP